MELYIKRNDKIRHGNELLKLDSLVKYLKDTREKDANITEENINIT